MEWRKTAQPLAALPTPPSSPPPSTSGPRNLTTADAKPGVVAYFDWNALPTTSIVHTQSWMTKTASDHPVAIVGTKNGGTISCCLQTTSFGGKTFREKYPNSNPNRNIVEQMYLPLDSSQPGHKDSPVTAVRCIQGAMTKASYANLSMPFEIETIHLIEAWNGDVLLDAGHLQRAFRDVVTGKTEILPPGDRRPTSPFAMKQYKVEDWGLPAVVMMPPRRKCPAPAAFVPGGNLSPSKPRPRGNAVLGVRKRGMAEIIEGAPMATRVCS